MYEQSKWPSGKELEVLRILQSEAKGMYGLKIVEASGGKITRGSIYVLLGRLEEKGFVSVAKTTEQVRHAGLPRPRYRLTAVGQRVLSAADAAFGLRSAEA